MSLKRKSLSWAIVCMPVVAALLLQPAGTQARGRGFGGFGGFGGAIGFIGGMGVIEGAIRHGGFPVPSYCCRARRGGGRSADTVSAIKPANVQSVDQSIDNFGRFSAYVRTFRQDRERDVDAAINHFLDSAAYFTTQYKVIRTANTNEITKPNIIAAADAEYEKSGLAKFAQFGADLWTRERLTVEIIDRGSAIIEPYYIGVAQRGLSKEDLNAIFAKTSAQVYAIALEAAELIGVEQSYDRLIRAIYENAPPVENEDEVITKAIDDAEQNFERLWKSANPLGASSGSQNRPRLQLAVDNEADYALSKRYRAKRVLLDCMSEGYETGFKLRIVGNEKKVPTILTDAGKNQSVKTSVTKGEDASASKESPGSSNGLIWAQLVAYSDYVCTPMIKELVTNFDGDSISPSPIKVANWNDFYANQGTSLNVSLHKN